MKKLVYIAGAGHSGTTMLGLLLGQHSQLVGLGEVYQVIHTRDGYSGLEDVRQKQAVCSCGKTIDHCSFWGSVDAGIRSAGAEMYQDRFAVVLKTLEQQYGNRFVGVDTSKSIHPLRSLLKSGVEVKVIHLIKDVRAYVVSYLDRAQVRQSRGLSVSRKEGGWFSEQLKKLPAYYFIEWHKNNRNIQNFLKSSGTPTLQIGYEELCLYPSMIMGRISSFLDIPMEPAMLELGDVAKNHIIRGNRMRHKSEKRTIRYDNRWFYRSEWLLPSVMFPHVMRFNRREVYRNTAGSLWEEKR
jgi:hypothetical protein